jgi:hypothetical protein
VENLAGKLLYLKRFRIKRRKINDSKVVMRKRALLPTGFDGGGGERGKVSQGAILAHVKVDKRIERGRFQRLSQGINRMGKRADAFFRNDIPAGLGIILHVLLGLPSAGGNGFPKAFQAVDAAGGFGLMRGIEQDERGANILQIKKLRLPRVRFVVPLQFIFQNQIVHRRSFLRILLRL